MTPPYENPYASAKGQWIRGNFHAHSEEYSPCGSVPLEQSVRQYAGIPSQVLAITDHGHITCTEEVQRQCPDLLLLNGFEHGCERHLLFVGTRDESLTAMPLPEALLRASDALTIISHPDPRPGTDYWPVERIRALPVLPDCLEIYNGHYGTARLRAKGTTPRYTHVWDTLLSQGCRIWGLGNDDFHDTEDFNNAFTMLRVPERTRDAVVDAIKHGHCYASTGLLLHDVRLEGNTVFVETSQPCAGQFIGPGGTVLTTGSGNRFCYPLNGESYVRFEGQGDAGLLFAQPIFRTTGLRPSP